MAAALQTPAFPTDYCILHTNKGKFRLNVSCEDVVVNLVIAAMVERGEAKWICVTGAWIDSRSGSWQWFYGVSSEAGRSFPIGTKAVWDPKWADLPVVDYKPYMPKLPAWA